MERSCMMEHNDIMLDITGTGEMICVCENCSCKIPHFAWYPRFGAPVYLRLEKAMLLEPCTDMDPRDRHRLQKYLTFAHWHRLINRWNACNTVQVSPMLHIPRYIDLMTCKLNCCKQPVMLNGAVLAEVFLDMDEEDERPHFHYRRTNGTEEMISLTGALYLEPVTIELSKAERTALASLLRSRDGSGIVYETMCAVWDTLNGSGFFDTAAYGDLFPMPDYTKLKRMKTQIRQKQREDR